MGDSSQNSVLTDKQRAFLQEGAGDMSDRGRRAAKARIRDRLQAAFDDLRLLLRAEADEDVGESADIGKVLTDVGAGRVWPLAAVLFIWSVEHPMFLDSEDFTEALSSPDAEFSPQEQMDRAAASFDSQVERGVQAALEFGEFDPIPEAINNELTVEIGPPVADMTDEELAELPRRTLDLLFRRGGLDSAEYSRIMGIKIGREEGVE